MLIDDVALACVASGPVSPVAISSATAVELFGIDIKKPVLYAAGSFLSGKVWGSYTDATSNDAITFDFKVDGVSVATFVTAAIAAGGGGGRFVFDFEILAQGQSSQLLHSWFVVLNPAGSVIAEAHQFADLAVDMFADHVFTLEAAVSVTGSAPTLTVSGFRCSLAPTSQTCWFNQEY